MMNIRKVFLATVAILFGYGVISDAVELYGLMNKYHTAFQQPDEFSFIRFYNTYQTLSFSDVMVQRGYLHHDYCMPTGFKNDSERRRLIPLIESNYKNIHKSHPGWPTSLGNIDHFISNGPNCLSNAKLINFEFKCKEAYATFACETGDYVREFTYTANGGEKCFFIDYKKSWGIEPKRTIDDTKRFFMGGISDSIFDSPDCEPTNR